MNIYLKNFINKHFEKPGKALDLGAGSFWSVTSLKQIGWDCEGVDIKTGIDLENLYLSKNRPFDLVYSNFALQFIENKTVFINTCYNNLKSNGWLFLQTMDISDEIMPEKNKLSEDELMGLLKDKFKDIKIEKNRIFDNHANHMHWHVVLSAIARKY